MRPLTLALLPFALLACAPEADTAPNADLFDIGTELDATDGWAHEEPSQPLPPPGVLDLRLNNDAIPGQTLEVQIDGVVPGATATLTLSTQGEGLGPCPAVLGGLCLDIVSPKVVGSGVADADGTARIGVTIPAGAPSGADIWLQAVVPNGANSDSSTVGFATLTTDCPNRPEVGIADAGLAAGVFNPGGFAVGLQAAYDHGLHDFLWDIDADGTPDEMTGFLEYEVYQNGAYVCSAFFDTDLATSIDPTTLVTNSGGLVYEAWQFEIIGSDIADTYTDCPAVDAAVWGTTDIREVLAADVVVGLGQLVDNAADLQTAYGADWPLVSSDIYGVYVSFDGVNAEEVSYGFGYEMADCGEYDNGGTMPSSSTVPMGLYDLSPWLVYLF